MAKLDLPRSKPSVFNRPDETFAPVVPAHCSLGNEQSLVQLCDGNPEFDLFAEIDAWWGIFALDIDLTLFRHAIAFKGDANDAADEFILRPR